MIGVGMLTSIGEGIGGYLWSDKTQMSLGTSYTINVMGEFGIGIGLGIGHFSGIFDDMNNRKLAASLLLGSGDGIYSGILLSKYSNYTRGDALMLQGSGLLGAYIALAGAVVADPINSKVYSSTATIGAIGGIVVGNIFARKNDFSNSQGAIICLSEIAGGLLGLGTGYIFASNSNDLEKVLMTTSAIGALAGYVYMIDFFSKKNKIDNENYSFHFNINPQALVSFSKINKQNANQYNMPIVRAVLTF
jgi:hypothetical protein